MGIEEPQDKHVTDRAPEPLVRILDFIDVVLFVPKPKSNPSVAEVTVKRWNKSFISTTLRYNIIYLYSALV